ncbi:hypothetical protein BDV12DRAFT_57860 [Aspergillus spectabilis]
MQIFKLIKLSAALAAASLPFLSLAKICEGDLLIYNPEDLDIIGRDCSTIIGDLKFNDTWSGPFVLQGVENITGTIVAERWQQGWVRQAQVTKVELLDLKYIFQLDFLFSPAINISAPKLEKADGIWLGQESHGSEAHFGALREVDYLAFTGNYSRVEVPVLESVGRHLSICSFPGCDEERGPSIINPLNITLPSLEFVEGLFIAGKTASISAPKLTTVSTSAIFQLPEFPASLNFPELDFVGEEFEAEGAISSIDMPSLRNTTSSIKISSTNPLNVSITLAGNPHFLGFFGAIEGLTLPNLKEFRKLQIHSDLPLDCEPLDEIFEPIVAEIVETESAREGRYHCTSTAVDESSAVKSAIRSAGVMPAAIFAGLVLW